MNWRTCPECKSYRVTYKPGVMLRCQDCGFEKSLDPEKGQSE